MFIIFTYVFMKRSKIRVISVIALGVVLGVAWLIHTSSGTKENAGPAPSAAAPSRPFFNTSLSVSGVIVKELELKDFLISNSTLQPNEEVDLSFETSGKITHIYFTEATQVHKGDLLAKVNDQQLQAQLQKNEVKLRLAEEDEYRQKMLLEKEAVSQVTYDKAATTVEELKADIELVKAQIALTELRAPFDGYVGLRAVSEGAYISPSTKIAKLTMTSLLKLEFSVPGKYAHLIDRGMPVQFEIDNQPYMARIYAIDSKIDIDTRTVLVRAMYDNRDGQILPGQYAGITLEVLANPNALAVPAEAITNEMGLSYVYLNRGGKAHRIQVGTGLRTESLVEITQGLAVGDTVITTGILQLREGLPVEMRQFISLEEE